jgi:hypothetical protein
VFLKKEIEGKGGFTMEIHRWEPGELGGDRKGGIVLTIRSPELERYFKEIGAGVRHDIPQDGDARFIEAPPLYRSATGTLADFGRDFGNDVVLPVINPMMGNGAWRLDWRLSPILVRKNEGKINVGFLRAVGLSEGVQFKMEGLYPWAEMRDIFGPGIKAATDQLHTAYFKKYRLHLHVPAIPPNDDVAA